MSLGESKIQQKKCSLAVQLNGQALQYITNPSPAVQEAAIANTARAIQFIENPSEDIKLQAVRAGWNNLSYLDNPSQELIDAALDQSGWAIKYIKDADHDLQLRAVNKNYDAVKYIKDPAPDVQLAAVRGNHEASAVENPTDEAEDLAIREDAQALRLIRNLGKEDFLHYLGLNVLVSNTSPRISASVPMTGAIPQGYLAQGRRVRRIRPQLHYLQRRRPLASRQDPPRR